MKNKQIKSAGIYLVANILNKAISFLTIPVFTRLMSTAEYGEVSTYLSFVTIIQFFMGLAAEYTIRNAYVDFPHEIPKYMSSMYFLTIISSIICGSIVLILNGVGLHISNQVICVCCLVQGFMTFVTNAMANKLMMENSYIKRSIVLAGPNLLSVILGLILMIWLPNCKVIGRIVGYVIALSIFGLIGVSSAWIKQLPKENNKYWKYILKISPPLIFHGLSVVILSQSDRIMITTICSSAETGIYSLVYNLSMIAIAVTNALEGVWTPWFTREYENKNINLINSRASQYLLIATFFMVGIILCGADVIRIMAPKNYWSGINMIPPLVVAS